MNLKLKIFKKNNIHSWATVYVGRKLELLTPEQIEKYAMEHLENNPAIVDPNISELAFGIKNSLIDKVLKKVIEKKYNSTIKKDGPIWNHEKRKWRYCLLKDLEKFIDNPRFFLDKLQILHADFGYPQDINEFLYGESVSSERNWDKNVKEPFSELLQSEKSKIESKNPEWPLSNIYYPLDDES